MKLTIKERIELQRILVAYNSNDTSEIELVSNIFEDTKISQDEAKKLGISQTPQGYSIQFEQENDFVFDNAELELLKKLHTVVESNSKVNMKNVSLCVKLRAIQVKEKESA